MKKRIATLTAVRPPARFGAIKIKGNTVKVFREKSSLDESWINGGFFVFEPSIFNYIKNDKTFLEKEPLEIISKKKQLLAFKHYGFWQCMDTKRDKDLIEKIFKRLIEKKILIVGGTGFIGRELIKRCLDLKWKVTSISTKNVKHDDKLYKVKYLKCDISKKNLELKIKENFDYVVNLAGYVNHKDKIKTYNSHYLGCKNLSDFFLIKR